MLCYIVQGEKGAQVLIVPELTEFVVSTMDKVKTFFSWEYHS